MTDLQDFLSFIEDNISDERIIINRRFKYGFKFYYANISLPTTSGQTLMLGVDNRHKILEISYGYGESLNYESEELCTKWSNLLEEEYQRRLPDSFHTMVGTFIEETEPTGKDFWRRWIMNKIFGKDQLE